MEILEKSIQNPSHAPYLDWIKSGKKTYEGRLKIKIKEWDLHIGKKMKFFDEKNKDSYVLVEIISLIVFADFGEAFDILGDKLIPEKTRDEVISLYNSLFHDSKEALPIGVTSNVIKTIGVVAIGFEIVAIS